ncbi:MAG: glycoside hydrolase family 127 protein [Proteobacteria bacterium]|nr:glycoside hydrolase family 127 protein [Pseudomonadota bacterium]
MNAQDEIRLGGPLGEALEASRRGRLHRFIEGPESAAIRLFDRAIAAGNTEGDWYGEHAGKWLVAAARAAARSGDDELRARVGRVADFLCDQQEADGYLGTYAPSRRFMLPQPPKPPTPPNWDGAPSVRTWDIWTHSYLILGLLEAHRQLGGNARWLQAACRIGDLCARTLEAGAIDITDLGNHFGLSATVLMDPACELFFATQDQRYLDLALRVLQQADEHPPLMLLRRALAGADPSEIATGKAYQLAWNLVGLAKLQRATGRADLREAVQRLWQAIRDHHLTLGGGPWGGVAHRSREVFNAPGGFFPQAYVETCSTLAWLQLNRELLRIGGDPQYAEEIERSAYNDLLGALAPNGEDWCYYSFANGRRVHTTYWRCCKSSGAMALEELPPLALQAGDDGLTVNLWTPLQATLGLGRGGARVAVEIDTAYPFDGAITLRLDPGAAPRRFTLRLRVPSWAHGATVRRGGECWQAQPGQYLAIDRAWQRGDTLQIDWPMAITAHRRRHANVQESRAPDGGAVRQTVLDLGYLALTRGPLVYATGLVDGYKTDETLRVPAAAEAAPAPWLQLVQTAPLPLIRMAPPGRAPLDFVPYYAAGGRADGAWRLTWLSTAPEETAPTA